MLDDPITRAEAASAALTLLHPQSDQQKIDRQAYTDLAGGTLTGDRAVAYWTQKWSLYLLELKLQAEIDNARDD